MNPNLLYPHALTRSVEIEERPKVRPHQKKPLEQTVTRLGILTTNKKVKFLRQFLIAAREFNIEAFIFSPGDVDWAQEMVAGWELVGNQQRYSWIRKRFPLPSVVYNQIKNRRDERCPDVQFLKKELARRSITLFNPDFFSKNDIYKVLSNTEAKELMPETNPFGNPHIFVQMLNRFPLVYIKPSGGSLGKGIVRVESHNSYFSLQMRQGEQNRNLRFHNKQELFQYLKRICGKNHVIQQGIYLKEMDGAPTDFRVHLQKNRSGFWEIVAIGGKIAGVGSITTHVHSGGRVMNAEQLLANWYPDNQAQMSMKLHEDAILIAECLEQRLQGVIGELGLDMGIDQDDQIWLFEVNSKPGKAIFRIPSLKLKGMESARHIMEFALFLAKDQVG